MESLRDTPTKLLILPLFPGGSSYDTNLALIGISYIKYMEYKDMEGLLNDVEKYDLPKSVEQDIKSVNSASDFSDRVLNNLNVSLQNIICSISAIVL